MSSVSRRPKTPSACPSSSACSDTHGIDARLSKYGSALLLHLLHLIHEVLCSCTSFMLKKCNDPHFRILPPAQWHVTPVCSVWTAGSESAALLLGNDEFRRLHSLSTTRFRSCETGLSWTYEISASNYMGRDSAMGNRNINYQIGPFSPVPFLCPLPLFRSD